MSGLAVHPWLLVPPEDYEAHMASEEVGQLQVLNRILAEDLSRFQPRSLAVPGCATGNGFEHIDPLTVVLQRPSARSAPVTPTPYLSLRGLSGILRLADSDEFRRMARAHGLEEDETRSLALKQGKSFFLGRYIRTGAA